MARMAEFQNTRISEREIAGTGLGTSPSSIAAYRDLQAAVYDLIPADTTQAQEAADKAQTSANSAQTAADSANTAASTAQTRADAAYERADDAYDLADGKVTQDVGLSWAAPTGTASRATFATYTAPTISNPPTQAEVQALAAAVQALSRALKAVVDDLRANHALTP